MKKLTIIFAFMAMLTMSGCVQNNGHIGHWFGQWKVERVTIDGQDDADYDGGVFFCFQGAVFGVRTSTGGMWYGRWEENDKGMVDVVFNTDESAVPPAYLHMHLDEKMVFRLVSHKDSDKVLEYVGPDGKTYTYYLKKW
jgi:lipoprotein